MPCITLSSGKTVCFGDDNKSTRNQPIPKSKPTTIKISQEVLQGLPQFKTPPQQGGTITATEDKSFNPLDVLDVLDVPQKVMMKALTTEYIKPGQFMANRNLGTDDSRLAADLLIDPLNSLPVAKGIQLLKGDRYLNKLEQLYNAIRKYGLRADNTEDIISETNLPKPQYPDGGEVDLKLNRVQPVENEKDLSLDGGFHGDLFNSVGAHGSLNYGPLRTSGNIDFSGYDPKNYNPSLNTNLRTNVQVNPRLNVNANLQYDYNKESGSKFNPSFGAKYQVNPNLNVGVQYNSGAPSFSISKKFPDGGKTLQVKGSSFNIPKSQQQILAEQARMQGDISSQMGVRPNTQIKQDAIALQKIKEAQEAQRQQEFYDKSRTELNPGKADIRTAFERNLDQYNLGLDQLEQQGTLAPGLRDFIDMGGLDKGLFLMGSAFEPMGNKAGFVKKGKFIPVNPQFEHLSQRLASEYRNGINRPLTDIEVEMLNEEFNTHGRLMEAKNRYGDFIGEKFYEGVKPAGYGFSGKAKKFIPNILNFNQRDRIFDTAEKFEPGFNRLTPGEKEVQKKFGKLPQQAINRENAFRLGLGLPQLKIGENQKTFEISPSSTTKEIAYKPKLSSLNRYNDIKQLKGVPDNIGVQALIKNGDLETLSKRYNVPFKSIDEAKMHYLINDQGMDVQDALQFVSNEVENNIGFFDPGQAVYKMLPDGKVRINDADGYFSIMGGFPWISDPANRKYMAEDTWDLHPFKKRDMVFKSQSGQKGVTKHPLSLLKNLELLKMMGGTPFKTRFEIQETPDGTINYREQGGKNTKTITLSTGKVVTIK